MWTASVVATLAAVVVAVPAPPAAVAAAPRNCSLTWTTPGDGSWSDPANWSLARAPRATDIVCLPRSNHPRVDLTRNATVAQLLVGGAVVTIAAGRTLDAVSVRFDGDGAVDGGGTLAAADNIQIPARSSAAATGVRVETSNADVVGTLGLQGGSRLRVAGALSLGDGAAVNGDGVSGTLVDVDLTVVSHSSAAVTAPLRFRRLVVDHGQFAAPALLGAHADGTTVLPDVALTVGRFTVPYPITTLAPGSSLVLDRSAVLAASAGGGSALTGLHGLLGLLAQDGGRETQYGDLAASGDGVFRVLHSIVTVESITATDGGRVELGARSSLRVNSNSNGVLTLRGVGPGGPSTVVLGGGTLAGSLDQGSGTVAFNPTGQPGVVNGNWRSGPSAHLALSTTAQVSHLATPTNILVHGTATLGGSVELGVGGAIPALGHQEVLFTATRGLTSRFSQLTSAEPGWRLRTNATSIVATYVGVGA